MLLSEARRLFKKCIYIQHSLYLPVLSASCFPLNYSNLCYYCFYRTLLLPQERIFPALIVIPQLALTHCFLISPFFNTFLKHFPIFQKIASMRSLHNIQNNKCPLVQARPWFSGAEWQTRGGILELSETTPFSPPLAGSYPSFFGTLIVAA